MPITTKTIIIGIAAIVAVVFIGLSLTSGAGKSDTPITYTTPQPTPSGTPLTSKQVTVTGMDRFIKVGASTDQVDAIKYALTRYARSGNNNYQTIAILPESVVQQRNPKTKTTNITFNGLFDNATAFRGRVDYNSISSIRLVISDTAGTQIHDSGVVDLYNGTGVSE